MALRRAREYERRGAKSTLLIVGLANPGAEYDGTRHNVGGDALRLVVGRRGARLHLEKRQRALSVTVTSPRGPLTLAVPTTFMNESGAAVVSLVRRTSITDLHQLVVVHDDLDLEPGRLQVKFAGGLAGHNGLRSIAQALGTQDFARLRVGIGRPPSKEQGADYVLGRAHGAQSEALEMGVALAANAIETLMEVDFDDAQRRVNAP